MLGSIIERCGDTGDESHMPLGWPMSVDGAVRQFCMHKTATIQEQTACWRSLTYSEAPWKSIVTHRNGPTTQSGTKKEAEPYISHKTTRRRKSPKMHCMYHTRTYPKKMTTDLECRIPHHLCPSMDDPTDIP